MKKTALLFALALTKLSFGQVVLDLNSLKDFKPVSSNWRKAGNVWADLNKRDTLFLREGTGILVNQPSKDIHQDLYTNFTHGDADIELDYMMAPGSNSGIYLQGRYELQLLDSWNVLNPRSSDNCGIYERWSDNMPEGQKGYEGHAPRLNASKAPGTWQHLKISFQAPRFDGNTKIENAKMLRVELNGVLIHENVELSGPTRGAISQQETASDALRIQGDHGTVALRNIVINNFNKPKPSLQKIQYSIFKGKFTSEPKLGGLKPLLVGNLSQLSSEINNLPGNEFLIRYEGSLAIQEPGDYQFNISTSGGNGSLIIDNDTVVPIKPWNSMGSIRLSSGDHKFQVLYAKYIDWARPSLAVSVKGPGVREFSLSKEINPAGNDVDPVLVNASQNTLLRSFMDIPGGKRIVHAVNVGSADKIHYTYDLDNGALFQVWRGNFLDATPMWHSRGDGSSRPTGVLQFLGEPTLAVQALKSPNDSWKKDTTGSGFRPKGYTLDEQDRPTFHYIGFGSIIHDRIIVLNNRQGIQRTITVDKPSDNFYFQLATSDQIEDRGNGLYLVGDKSYYIKIESAEAEQPTIREIGGKKELLVRLKSALVYSILF